MKRILNLLKYESWPSWLGPTIATVGIGGFFIGRNVLTQSSGISLTSQANNLSSSALQDKPVLALAEDPETLTHSYLIRQSCALSFEAASKLYTHIYLAVEDNCSIYDKVLAELATIYEETSPDTILYMNDEFQMRFVSLQKDADDLKKTINELEITSQFAKRLLDLNAEVSYIGGAEFISNQASERSISIERYISRLFENVRLKEYELAKAKTSHIERLKKSNEDQETQPNSDQVDEKTETRDDENETNFDIMNSRED